MFNNMKKEKRFQLSNQVDRFMHEFGEKQQKEKEGKGSRDALREEAQTDSWRKQKERKRRKIQCPFHA
jgi:hypothetical protein